MKKQTQFATVLKGVIQIHPLGQGFLVLLCLLLPLGSGFLLAQNTWTQLNPPTNPGGRDSHNMVWDSESQRAIIYGGHAGNQGPAWLETWAYNYSNNTWTNMNPPTNPGNKAEYAFAYNSVQDKIIMYIGIETWAYDFNANSWSNLNPSTRPDSVSVNYGCRMAYDSESDKVIMHDNTTGKTWAYDYTTNLWQNMNPAVPKPAADWRQITAITYDSNHDRVIALTPVPQLTWAYDYNTNTWQQRAASPNAPINGLYDMDYDSQNDKIIMYGDNQITSAYDYTTDTWTDMTPSAPYPYAHHHAMTYMPQFGKVLFYGGCSWPAPCPGQNQTWEYVYASPTGVNSFDANESVRVYPNPASDVIRYEISISREAMVTVKLMDVLGRNVILQSYSVEAGITQKEMNVSALANGAYLLQVSTDKGLHKSQKQFVIK